MLEVTDIYVPLNVFRMKGLEVGLDSYFWTKLERRYNRVLLLATLRELEGLISSDDIEKRAYRGCALKPLVSHERQLRDLEEIARGVGVERYWAVRVYSLLGLRGLFERAVGDVSEAIYSSRLARELLEGLEPSGRVVWSPVDRLLSQRVYRSVRSDRGFAKALEEATEACRP